MAMPRDIEEIWDFLHREVTWLQGRWRMYRQLYGTSEARIDALNRVAPTLFSILQNVLLDEVQLTLSRLADPPTTGRQRRPNATLETLLNRIEGLDVPSLTAELRTQLASYRLACKAILERRNKRLAHYDLHTHISADAETLLGPSRAEIETALDTLRAFMRTVYEHFEHSYMAYEHFAPLNDAESLLRAVAQALRYQELQEVGRIPDEDLLTSRIYQDLSRTPSSNV